MLGAGTAHDHRRPATTGPLHPGGVTMRELRTGSAVPAVESWLQPIVDLQTRHTVAFEALSRSRRDGDGGFAVLLDWAQRHDRVAELDWACRCSGMRALLTSRTDVRTLFLNAEPGTADLEPSDPVQRGVLDEATAQLEIVVEVTERALFEHPARALRLAAWARERGWAVAVDDVGARRESLAMLPFLAPDVVKLDMALVHDAPDREQARCLTAVMAHVERSGAILLAEGIERPEHLEQAHALGAKLGQGYLFGVPARVPRGAAPSREAS